MHSNTQSESLLIPHRRTEDNKQAEYLVTLGALQLATTSESRRAEEHTRSCQLENVVWRPDGVVDSSWWKILM